MGVISNMCIACDMIHFHYILTCLLVGIMSSTPSSSSDPVVTFHPPLVSLVDCLHNVFLDEKQNIVAINTSIVFMDRYLVDPSNRSDLDLSIRYCQHLAQLSSYLDEKKQSFPKLHRSMSFRFDFNDTPYTSSCHLMELLLSVVQLGVLAVLPLVNALSSEQRHVLMSPPGSSSSSASTHRSLLLTKDIESTHEALDGMILKLRKVIGLFHYCIQRVVPNASYVVMMLNEMQPQFVDHLKTNYHTLRVIGCWMVAARQLRVRDRLPLADQSRALELTKQAFRSCILIADDIRNLGLPVMVAGQVLRASAKYELDLLYVGEWYDDPGRPNGIAMALLRDTQKTPGSRVYVSHASIDVSSTLDNTIETPWSRAELEEQMRRGGHIDGDRNTMREGVNPLSGVGVENPFSGR